MSIAIVIPAAGASKRMGGRDKLLEVVDSEALLRRVAKRALAVTGQVIIALPDRSDRRDVIADLAVTIAEVRDPSEGMAASIRAGVACVFDTTTGIMIVPADMPGLDADSLSKVIQHFEKNQEITRATDQNGVAGHPVVFPIALKDALLDLTGDQGARAILKGRRVELVPLDADHAMLDLDTPEDWRKWRARQDNA